MELGLLRLYNLGNSQPMQIAKIVKIRRFTVRKACFEEKAKGVATWPYSFVAQKKQHRKHKKHSVSAAVPNTRKVKKPLAQKANGTFNLCSVFDL